MDFAVPLSVRVNRPRKIFPKALAVRIVCKTLMLIVATLPLLAQSPYPDFSSISGLVANPGKPPNPMQFFKVLHRC